MDLVSNETIKNVVIDTSNSSGTGVFTLLREHPYITLLLISVLTLYGIAYNFTPAAGPDEPPLISHPIPFFGHLIGLLLNGVKYFYEIGEHSQLPIFTLPILNSKTYVITSPDLVTACMRESRTLSFNPFMVEMSRRLAHFTDADMEAIKVNMDDKSKPGYVTDLHRIQSAALAPGPALDRMYNEVLNNMADLLSKQLSTDQSETRFDVYRTFRDATSLSAIRATYGPENPFDVNPGLIDAFWCFEAGLKGLLLDVYPNITVHKAHQARSRCRDAFRRYYQNQSHLKASTVIQERYRIALKHGQTLNHIASFDLGFSFGVLGNATPSMVWMVLYLFSDPTLLQTIRDETAHLVNVDRVANEVTIDLRGDRYLRTACPILTSVFHETLRVIASPSSSGRFVLQDTVLTSPSTSQSYLLKAGSTIQIPSHSLHHPRPQPPPPPPTATATATTTATATQPPTDQRTKPDPFTTGSPSTTFSATRFRDLGSKVAPEPERSINGSFRAFGGGATLCPGRKFAFMEIVSAAVMSATVWDVCGDDGETLVLPQMDVGRVAIAMAKPRGRVWARAKRRPGMQGLRVRVVLSGDQPLE